MPTEATLCQHLIILYRGCLVKRGGRSFYLTSIYCKKCSERQKVNEKEAGDGRYYLPKTTVSTIIDLGVLTFWLFHLRKLFQWKKKWSKLSRGIEKLKKMKPLLLSLPIVECVSMAKAFA